MADRRSAFPGLIVIRGVCLVIPLARSAALLFTAGLCLIRPARVRRAASAWKGDKSRCASMKCLLCRRMLGTGYLLTDMAGQVFAVFLAAAVTRGVVARVNRRRSRSQCNAGGRVTGPARRPFPAPVLAVMHCRGPPTVRRSDSSGC